MNARRVEDRLRRAADECDAVADRIVADRAAGAGPVGRAPGTPRPARRLLAAAVVLAVAAGGGLVATRGGGGDDVEVSSGPPPSSPAPAVADEVAVTLPDGTELVVELTGDAAGWSVVGFEASVAVDGDDRLRPFQVFFHPGDQDRWMGRQAPSDGELVAVADGVWRAELPGSEHLLVVRDGWTARVLVTLHGQDLLPPDLVDDLVERLDFTVGDGGPVLTPVEGVELHRALVTFAPGDQVGADQIDLGSERWPDHCQEREGDPEGGSITVRCFLDGAVWATGTGAGARAVHHVEVRAGGSTTAGPRTGPTTTTPPVAVDGSPGPSQPPADAARDGVLAAVAERPASERISVRASVPTDDGTWVISRGSAGLDAAAEGCVIGDGEGVYGRDFICTAEYGEVLLLDHRGAVERAFPMPGLVPTWLHVTDDAVYGGRIGDGGLPDSTIFRIDRASLRLDGVVFPFRSDGSDPGEVALPGWRTATPAEAEAYPTLVTYQPAIASTPVTSWTGSTSVELPGIEALFDP